MRLSRDKTYSVGESPSNDRHQASECLALENKLNLYYISLDSVAQGLEDFPTPPAFTSRTFVPLATIELRDDTVELAVARIIRIQDLPDELFEDLSYGRPELAQLAT